MILAAPVWTYWLAMWWLVVDAVVLTILGIEYYRKVLRPRWELRAAQARAQEAAQTRPEMSPTPSRGAAVGQPERAAIPSATGERPARDLLAETERGPAEDERQTAPVSRSKEPVAR